MSSGGSSGGRAPDGCGSGPRFGGRGVIRAMGHSVVASRTVVGPDWCPRDGDNGKLSEVQGLDDVTGSSTR
ncbi:hypothetical protein DLS55_13645 [Staphylococcus pseudintermedius]|nr:hypothetical protein DLS55_13645 [Staphylococcus pseudintermedius]HCW42285.1 hypothetical protein [Cutibacterium acnes]